MYREEIPWSRKYLHGILTGNHMCSLERFNISIPDESTAITLQRQTFLKDCYHRGLYHSLVCMEPRFVLECCSENSHFEGVYCSFFD